MRRTAAIAAALGILLLLGLAQLLLPSLAAQRLRDRLAASGSGVSVHVEAFPALELLWHHADRVVIHMDRYRSGAGNLSRLLAQAGDVGTLEASVGELDTGLLTLRQASLTKRGARLAGSAAVAEADLRRALPILTDVTPVASPGGELILRGTVTVLGARLTAEATVAARNGGIVLTPDVPFGALASITVFTDPRVYVSALSATPSAGGFTVSATASLR